MWILLKKEKKRREPIRASPRGVSELPDKRLNETGCDVKGGRGGSEKCLTSSMYVPFERDTSVSQKEIDSFSVEV